MRQVRQSLLVVACLWWAALLENQSPLDMLPCDTVCAVESLLCTATPSPVPLTGACVLEYSKLTASSNIHT